MGLPLRKLNDYPAIVERCLALQVTCRALASYFEIFSGKNFLHSQITLSYAVFLSGMVPDKKSRPSAILSQNFFRGTRRPIRARNKILALNRLSTAG